MNKAEIAAARRIDAQRQNRSNGVRKMPPPVPVKPERNPMPAPTPIEAGTDGGSMFGGSPWRKNKRAAENKKHSADQHFEKGSRQRKITSEVRRGHRKQSKGPEEPPRKISGPPELERANGRDQDVENEGCGPDESRGETAERHHRDVTGSARVTDRRIKESNNRDPGEEQNQMRIIHVHGFVLRMRAFLDKERRSRRVRRLRAAVSKARFLGFAEQNGSLKMTRQSSENTRTG